MVLHKYICWEKAPNNFPVQSNIKLKKPLFIPVSLSVGKTNLQELTTSQAQLLVFISIYI